MAAELFQIVHLPQNNSYQQYSDVLNVTFVQVITADHNHTIWY